MWRWMLTRKYVSQQPESKHRKLDSNNNNNGNNFGGPSGTEELWN